MTIGTYLKEKGQKAAVYTTITLMGLGAIACNKPNKNEVSVNAQYVTVMGDTTKVKLVGEYDKNEDLLYLQIKDLKNSNNNQVIPGDTGKKTLDDAVQNTLSRINPKK